MRPWLGQVRLVGEQRKPFLGQAERYHCIKILPDKSEVKLEFEKQGLECINTWGSPPGIYPGVPLCRPDGKPWECPPPPAPQQMSGRRRRMGQGGNGCKIPGTQIKPVFDSNWNGTGACGVTWVDTSTVEYPDCVQAPPGYPGQPAQGGWIPPSCAQGAPPPPPPPAPAPAPAPTPAPAPAPAPAPTPTPTACPPGMTRVAGVCMPNNYVTPVTQGSCPPPGHPEATESNGSGCCTPTRYERDPSNPDRPCIQRQECYDFSGQLIGSSASQIEDSLCDGAVQPPPAETMAPIPEETVAVEAPPTIETQPYYEAGPPVLPPPSSGYTVPSTPTGAFPGAPFASMPPLQPPMKAIAPAPRPESCPLGPVPLAKWANQCALAKLNQ